jgi:hypothetical protein
MLVNCVIWALHRPLTWKLIWKENTKALFDFLSWNQFSWFKNVISTHLNYWLNYFKEIIFMNDQLVNISNCLSTDGPIYILS